MSFDRQAARAFLGKIDTRTTSTDANVVNPGMDEHGDLYARLTRTPKRSAGSTMLAVLVGAGVLAGAAVLVVSQTGSRINAADIAAPSVSASASK